MLLVRQQILPIGCTGRPDGGGDQTHIEDTLGLELFQAVKGKGRLHLEDPDGAFDHVRPDGLIIPIDLMGLGVRPAQIPAGVPDDLDGFENQEIILGNAHLMSFVHIQHEAQLSILVEHPIVAGEMDGADDHAGRMDRLGDLGTQKPVVVVEQVGVLLLSALLVSVEFLFNAVYVFQGIGTVLVGMVLLPLEIQGTPHIVDDPFGLDGAKGGNPRGFVCAEPVDDVLENGRAVRFHTIDVDLATLGFPIFSEGNRLYLHLSGREGLVLPTAELHCRSTPFG